MPDVAARITRFHSLLSGQLLALPAVETVLVNTQLDHFIAIFEEQAAVLAVPLDLVLAQLLALSVLFVVVLVRAWLDAAARALATLTSRGASPAGLLLAAALPFGTLLLLAAALAPWLAAVSLSALFERLVPALGALAAHDPRYLARVAAPGQVRLVAFLGAACFLLVVLGALARGLRRTTLDLQRERAGWGCRPRAASRAAGERPRLLLDAALLGCGIIGLLGIITTRSQGALVSAGGSDAGLGSGGWLAALALSGPPLLLLVACAGLLLRLLTFAAALAARLALRQRGVAGLFTLVPLARGTVPFQRLVLLLLLVGSVGSFAVVLQTSLERTLAEQALLLTGGDLRVEVQSSIVGTGLARQVEQTLARAPGVQAITPIARVSLVTTGPQDGQDGQNQVPVEAIGVDAATLEPVLAGDGPDGPPALMAVVRQLGGQQAAHQAGTSQAPLWGALSPALAASLHLRLGDRLTLTAPAGSASGAPLIVMMGALAPPFPTTESALDAASTSSPGGTSGTLSTAGGYLLVDRRALQAALLAGASANGATVASGDNGAPADTGASAELGGPSEYWLRTADGQADTRLLQSTLLRQLPNEEIAAVTSRREVTRQLQAAPLPASLAAVLTVEAGATVALALVASAAQTVLLGQRQRQQSALLRALGGARRQLLGALVRQQAGLIGFGLLAGSALGGLLLVLLLPLLRIASSLPAGQFSASAAGTLHILPPLTLAANPLQCALLAVGLGLLLVVVTGSLLWRALRANLAQGLRIEIGG